jgi:uncharacterized protein (DUF58 family)
MRGALAGFSGLTGRGRGLLCGGLAAAFAGLLIGQTDLLRVGLLLVALPAVAALAVGRTRYQLSCTRRLEPARVSAGQSAEVRLRLENLSRLPTGLLLAEDTLPYVLGGRPRFVVDKLAGQSAREVGYRLRTDIRGRYQVGPLTLRLSDPFGLCELSRSFSGADTLTVTPAVLGLPTVRLRGDWTGTGDSAARWVSSAGEDDVAPREYRDGDDLRRVHWRSTAKYGELMVRREEQPWQSRAALLLDSRRMAHRGTGPASSLEWAVTAAASIGVHLYRRGYSIRFVSETGASLTSGRRDVSAEDALLDRLAVVELTNQRSLAAAASVLRYGPGEGLLVAVLGGLSPADLDELVRLRRPRAQAVALLIDPTGWDPGRNSVLPGDPNRPAQQARLLRAAGWRVLPVVQSTRLPDIWPEAAGREFLLPAARRGAALHRAPVRP